MPETATMDEAAGLPARGEALLTVSGLEGWYGESHVLHGIAFDAEPGEVVTLTPNLRRVTSPNPSMFTFKGTNTYIVGRGLPSTTR